MSDGKFGLGIGGGMGANGMLGLGLAKQRSAIEAVEQAKQRAEVAQAGGSQQETSPEVENAASKFEAMLLGQMMKAMWKTVPKSGFLSGTREQELYQEMLNDQVSQEVSRGQGIGIKEVIIRELNRRSND